jgi:aspartate aminotransferase
MKIAAKAILMMRDNIDIINFSVGEPDFATPNHIKEAAKRAIDKNLTKYTLNKGLIELREAIANKLKTDNNLVYDIDQIIVSNGAKQAILNVLMSIVEEGDEVIIPSPHWVSYPEMVKLAGGIPIILKGEEKNNFKITSKELVEATTEKTRALILCNPCNPTGAVYKKEELEDLASVIEKNTLYAIADEVYEKLVYTNEPFVSLAAISPKLKERTIVVNGVSKAYAMTGWRIGYAAGALDIIDGADIIQGHSTCSASSISQYASLEALRGPADEILKMRLEYEKRKNYIVSELINIDGIFCQQPEGAFYVFPNVSAFYGKSYKNSTINDSNSFAAFLLDEAKVVVIPGAAFGSDEHIRLSYATSIDNIKEGLNRIKNAIKAIN